VQPRANPARLRGISITDGENHECRLRRGFFSRISKVHPPSAVHPPQSCDGRRVLRRTGSLKSEDQGGCGPRLFPAAAAGTCTGRTEFSFGLRTSDFGLPLAALPRRRSGSDFPSSVAAPVLRSPSSVARVLRSTTAEGGLRRVDRTAEGGLRRVDGFREAIAKPDVPSSSPREERVGRGLRRGEFRTKTHLLSPALSSIGWRRGRRSGVSAGFAIASRASDFASLPS